MHRKRIIEMLKLLKDAQMVLGQVYALNLKTFAENKELDYIYTLCSFVMLR